MTATRTPDGAITPTGATTSVAAASTTRPAPTNLAAGTEAGRPLPMLRSRVAWLWGAIWLIYLVQPINEAWHRPHLWQRVAGLVGLGLFGFANWRPSCRG